MDPPDHIPERHAGARVRASFAQERMWFLEQMDPENAVYNQLNAFRLNGPLDADILRRSFTEVLRRHEALRTNLGFIDGQLYQYVSGLKEPDMPVIDLSGETPDMALAETGRLAIAEAKRPFDLEKEPLIRAFLLKLSPGEHMLVLTTHHAIFDGWSVSVLINDLSAIYEACLNGSPVPPPPTIQYADYALWQREKFERGDLEPQMSYWKGRLEGELPLLELPVDHPRPMAQSFKGAVYTTMIPPTLVASLKALARREKATLFVVLLSAYDVLMHRYTGQEDIIMGCPIAGRTHRELEGLVGLLVNTLPIRARVTSEMTFADLLRQLRKTAFDAYDNQDLPFEKLVESLPLNRLPSYTPVFQTLFLLRNFPDPKAERAGIVWERYDFDYATAKFDFTLELTDTPEGLQCRFEYPPALFDEPTIVRIAGHWETLLHSIASDPGRMIGTLDLLTEEERHRQLVEWNTTKTAYPRDTPVHRIFESRAKATPGAVAVVHNGERITYGQLNARANRLARYLRSRGTEPGMAIAVCMERSIDLVVSELAVLKAGGAYIPIDPTDPSDRIAFMLQDSHADILLSRNSLKEAPESSRLLSLNTLKDEINGQSGDDLPDAASADSAAYVMYTSGSTGRPKGVTVSHRGIVRLVINTNYVDIKPEDVVSLVSNPMFDTSTFDVWGALLNGARLVIFDKETVLSPKDFAALVEKEHVTVLFLTTQLLNLFSLEIPSAFRRVRDVLFAGEAADAASVRRILKDGPQGRLINVYGPTENTTFSTWYLIRDVMGDNVPIGKPIANSTAYILDACMQPVPVGVTGEIYLGGDGVALGYHERPEQTAAAFVDDPFSPGAKLYRTGDLACYLPDGNIRFLGRRDHQVKIRGFRVEPDEVKAVLAAYPYVRSALVTTKEVKDEKRLIAYLLSRDGVDIEGLREYTRKMLPEYMVPAHFIAMGEFPMTSTGKIDYRALPLPGTEDTGDRPSSEGPRDELELELARIWREVLGVASVGIDDNFFDIGGHSLAAVRMFARVDEKLGRRLPVNMIFLAPTIRSMADMMRDEPAEWNALLPLRKGSAWPPLFCINTVVGTLTEYQYLLQELQGDWHVYGLQTPWHDKSLAPVSIEDLAAYFIKEIKSVQPEGPYSFLGYCYAGIVAYEMARQLSEMGDKVSFLGFTDIVPPKYPYHLDVKSAKLFVRKIRLIFLNIIRAAPDQRRKLIMSLPGLAWQFIDNMLQPLYKKEKQHESVATTNPEWIQELHPSYQSVTTSNYLLQKKYTIKPYKGNVTVFFSCSTMDFYKDATFFSPSLGWDNYVEGKAEPYIIPGEHTTMIQTPNVKAMARIVEECLQRARRDQH